MLLVKRRVLRLWEAWPEKVFSSLDAQGEGKILTPQPHHPEPALPFLNSVKENSKCRGGKCGSKAWRGACVWEGRQEWSSQEVRGSQQRTVWDDPFWGGRKGGGQGAQGTPLSDGKVTFLLVNPCLPMRHITHRPEGSSRSLGNTGSGCSNSSYEGSTGTSRSPPRRRRGRLPGSPDQQTPTLEGCTEKPTLAAAPCWGRPVPERVRAAWGRRHLVTGCRAPRLRRGSEAERCRPSQGWGVEGRDGYPGHTEHT